MAGNQFEKEWQQLHSISSRIQNLKVQYAGLRSHYDSLSVQLSALSPSYDEDGNDVNEGSRVAVESQMSSVRKEMDDNLELQAAMKIDAESMAQGFQIQRQNAREKANAHHSAATQLGRVSGYRFGVSTANAGRAAADSHSAYYLSVSEEMKRLMQAAQAVAAGGTAGGSAGNIADYGSFKNPGSRAGVARASAGNRSFAAGQAHTKNSFGGSHAGVSSSGGQAQGVSQATLSSLGYHSIPRQNHQPDFSAVSHGTVQGTFMGKDGDAKADEAFAKKMGMSASEVRDYRTQNGLAWQSNAQGTEASLIPESFQRDYQNSQTEKTAFQKLSDYMNAHNYGKEDFETYSKDPEWQRLHKEAFPNYVSPAVKERQEKQRNLASQLDNAGFCTQNFGQGVAVRSGINPNKWYAVGSRESYQAFDAVNTGGNYTRTSYSPEQIAVKTIDPSKIEGIDLFNEVNNPERFWSQHEREGTEESFMEIASHIPDVSARLKEGASIDELSLDPVLGSCTNIYFRQGGTGMPTVYEGDGFYEFVGNGRHRVLAARAMGYSIPVRIIGHICKK